LHAILSYFIPILAILISLIAVFLVYGAISSAKSSLLNDINKIGLETQSIVSDMTQLKVEISNINTKHYDALATEHKVMNLQLTSMSGKVETLDNSLKNFYSKWAVRLGKLNKDDDTEKVVESEGTPELPQIIYPEQQLPQVKKSGFGQRSSWKKRVG